MIINKCRVCGSNFFEEPLLRYKNMPSVAQYFPDAESLESDKGINLEVCQCLGCGIVQLRNEPVPYYKEVIRAAAFSEEMNEFRKRQFKDFVKKYSLNGKKIVEIGCGKGEYLSIMKKQDVVAYGIEANQESVAHCIRESLEVSKGFVEEESYKIENSPFDAFFMLSFLEHLPDPNSTLKGVYNNLVDDAVGIVEVPNFEMILRKKLFSEFVRDHLFYFTKETLKITLMLNGFEVIECKEVWHDYILSAIVKKKRKLDLTDLYKYQEEIKNEINEFINRFGDKKVAIWGAGHQALTVMSLADLSSKIKYVVDSATFKQGKYTPVTHIPIVSPETLNSDPIEAVIVMTGSYSDEVARIIREKYGNRINISILRDYGLERV